jgi:hypothetical protein
MDQLRVLLLFATVFVASSVSLLTDCGSAPMSTPPSQAIPTLPAAPSSPAANPMAAYVFTVDSMTQTASEFSLSASGQLQQTQVSVPYALPVSTAHGVVYQVPKQLGSLQSYTLRADGSLQPQGASVSYAVNQSASFASDNSSFIYAMDSATAVTLDPTGHFLLATFQYCNDNPNCTTPGKLVALSINQTTGALTVTSDVVDGVYPYQVTAAVISH